MARRGRLPSTMAPPDPERENTLSPLYLALRYQTVKYVDCPLPDYRNATLLRLTTTTYIHTSFAFLLLNRHDGIILAPPA